VVHEADFFTELKQGGEKENGTTVCDKKQGMVGATTPSEQSFAGAMGGGDRFFLRRPDLYWKCVWGDGAICVLKKKKKKKLGQFFEESTRDYINRGTRRRHTPLS